MIARERIQKSIVEGLTRHPAVALLGPRQCGKTTLARQVAAETGARFFDLENPDDAAALENPMLALEGLRGLVVLDEVQRRADSREAAKNGCVVLGNAGRGGVGFIDSAGWQKDRF